MMMHDTQEIKVDNEGYLCHLADWNEALANTLASIDGITLTDDHWQVIHVLRNFYQAHQHTPPMRVLVKAMQAHFPPEKTGSAFLYQLFPDGPAKQASKYAGLPKPKHCI